MKTDAQLKAEIYTAITTDTQLNTLIGGRLFWFSQKKNTCPYMVYSVLDSNASYVLGGCVIMSHEFIDIQIDTMVKFGDIQLLSDIIGRLKVVMSSIGWMMIQGNNEILEDDVITKFTRWRLINA